MITKSQLTQIFKATQGKHVLVVGDVMLDEWIIGDATRISPEAPVPVIRFAARRTAPGGAANVAMNLLSLGAKVSLLGVIGNDAEGQDLAAELATAGIDTSGLVTDSSRPTTRKTRIVAMHQQVARVDRETNEPLPNKVQSQLWDHWQTHKSTFEAACFSDYDKGLCSSDVVQKAIADAAQSGKIVTAGPKPANLEKLVGADFVSLNEKEAKLAAAYMHTSQTLPEQIAPLLREAARAQALAVTRGENGVLLAAEKASTIAAHSVEMADVAGAGDTFLAGATIGLLAGQNALTATKLGNLAAAAGVARQGVVAVKKAQLEELL